MSIGLTYAFRKSAFEKPCHWTVTEQGVVRTDEHSELQIPYKEILSIRLQAQPYFRYRHNNYCCEITAVRGVFQILSTHYVGFAEFEDRADTYTPFVKAFVKNLKSQNPSCIINTGQKPSAFSGNIALIVASVLLLYFLWSIIPLSGKLLPIMLVLLGAWSYLNMSTRVNRPRTLENDEIPDYILPQKQETEEARKNQD
ncbi:hypothetical protein [Parapedobacter pyrenivorans]|uniref:hypothetical protein n=1 Tax=Parapedobacter pyrenivorans TaxID=1305674 RepID=UPI00333E97E3